ncbi:Mammalian cell entry related domain protein [Mycobacterium sp. MBM]|nr:Mammalian cell entry related domain protein [Mycobacterium sp. MBM]
MAVVLIVVVVTAFVVGDPFRLKDDGDDRISVSFVVPYIAQGVIDGTALVLHGVQVGTVTGIANQPGGDIRVDAELQRVPTTGLTDTLRLDYRPVNYFGVSGINLSPGEGGQNLRNGVVIDAAPTGNFTLQAMLTRFGQLTNGVITPELVRVVDRITRYTDALNPLIETVFIATGAVADVQTVPASQLVANTAGATVALPSLIDSLVKSGDDISRADNNWMREGAGDLSDDQWYNEFGIPTYELIVDGLFGSIGKLEASHLSDLLPLVNGIQTITDTVPPLLRPEATGDMLTELRSRFQRLYGGTPDQGALQVKIVLDNLPGVAAPIDAIGGP